MRILLIILTVLFVLVSAGMGLMIAGENLAGDSAEKLAELETMVASAGANLGPEMQDLLDKARGYKTSGIGGAIVGLLSLVVLVLGFMKNEKNAMIVGGVTALASVVFILMAPGFDTGEHGPASPRNQVMVFAIPAILASATAWLAAKKGAAKATPAPAA